MTTDKMKALVDGEHLEAAKRGKLKVVQNQVSRISKLFSMIREVLVTGHPVVAVVPEDHHLVRG